jgi:hypothetical protein
MHHATIRVHADVPDYSALPDKVFDREQSVYVGAEEEVPDDCPVPLGKEVVMTVGRMRVGLPLSGIQDCRQGLGGIQNHTIKADCRVSATCIPSTHSTHNSVDNSLVGLRCCLQQ